MSNVLRFANILLFGIGVGYTSWIIKAYYIRYRNRINVREGFLPHHVWLVGTSHLMLMLALVAEQVGRWNDPFRWTIVLGLVAQSISVYSLHILSCHEQKMRN